MIAIAINTLHRNNPFFYSHDDEGPSIYLDNLNRGAWDMYIDGYINIDRHRDDRYCYKYP